MTKEQNFPHIGVIFRPTFRRHYKSISDSELTYAYYYLESWAPRLTKVFSTTVQACEHERVRARLVFRQFCLGNLRARVVCEHAQSTSTCILRARTCNLLREPVSLRALEGTSVVEYLMTRQSSSACFLRAPEQSSFRLRCEHSLSV